MSSRFLQKDFLQCGKCKFVQRFARGYRPIANPVLFNSQDQCRNFHNEQRACVGYHGLSTSSQCPQCKRMHTEWTWLDFQTFIDQKLKLSPSVSGCQAKQ